MKRILLSWSSGKDSAWALHVLRQRSEYEIAGLLTTFNQEFNRVAMHGVRRELVEQQAATAGLPLWTIPLPWPCSNEQYEALMAQACAGAINRGIEAIAFGDLFLEDIRAYRERQLSGTGIEPLFPIWRFPTHKLAKEMIASGLKATLTCVDTKKLSADFAGRNFDENLLHELPDGIDPCGENGEFHTFAHTGSMFCRAIPMIRGNTVLRDGFAFADLLSPAPTDARLSTHSPTLHSH
ncbi:MAG: ATP-binding protein [Terriglobales bacterium]|jgi:uncharacterized protein (TIGR00290 family)